MYPIPVISVIGCEGTGKTTIIEKIIQELKKRGYQTSTVYINQRSSVNVKDEYMRRYVSAGANSVIGVSEKEINILMNDGIENFSINQLLNFIPETGVILIEDSLQTLLKDEEIGKIICVGSIREYENLKEESKGEIIAFCSLLPMKKPVLRLEDDTQTILKRVLKYVEKKRKIWDILQKLPGLNCRKCGYPSCQEMAAAIYKGESRIEDCYTLRTKPKLKTRITFNGVEVPIQWFVSEIISKSVLGMVSSLKGVSIKGDEKVHIEISS